MTRNSKYELSKNECGRRAAGPWRSDEEDREKDRIKVCCTSRRLRWRGCRYSLVVNHLAFHSS
jgi:hypothetical protein